MDRFSGIAIILLATLPLAACSNKTDTEHAFIAAGMTGKIHVDRSVPGDAAASLVADSLAHTVSALDTGRPENEIARLNRVGGSARLPLSALTFRFIDLCRHYHQLTDGAFDLTTGAIAELWAKGTPTQYRLHQVMDHSGMQFVDTADNDTALLVKPGIALSPGLAAPAYALDMATVQARRKFEGAMMITFGPFARSYGSFAEGDIPSVTVTIAERFDGRPVGRIYFPSDQAMANHSLPHRDGKSEPPLIDMRTGYPAIGTRQVVVIGPLTLRAHALAEAMLVLGRERGGSILTNFPGYEVMLVPNREPVEAWMTPGFRAAFVPEPDSPLVIREWVNGEL